jgi:hypothetical protein
MSDATRETAYTVWKACGQNMSRAVKKLSSAHGIDVTRQTLAAWRDGFDWTARAARSEAEVERLASGASDESLMGLLLAQKEKYRRYLEGLAPGRIDNQATYALNHIVKTIMDIRKKGDSGAVSAETLPGELRPITTAAEAVEALREAVELKLNRMLSGDGVDLSAVRDLQKALELIETMRARHQAETGEKVVKKGGISAEGANQIRARILGIESK